MKIIIIPLILFLFIGTISAQQELILTKYTFNSLFFNPAYVGSHHGQGTAMIQYRNQWLGYDGSPKTLQAGVEGSFFKNKVGLGLILGQDKIGIDKRTDLYTNYGYKFKLGPGKLSLGIRFGASFYSSNLSDLKNVQPGDSYYDTNPRFMTVSGGLGAYWKAEQAYIGISIPTLFKVNSKAGDFLKRHLYFHTGMIIGGEYSDLEFEPSILVKYEPSVPIQYTVGLNMWYKRKFAVGIAYRTDDAFAVLFELLLQERYRLSFAYDFTTSRIRHHSAGTPEIMLGYNFNTDPANKKIKNIRHRGVF